MLGLSGSAVFAEPTIKMVNSIAQSIFDRVMIVPPVCVDGASTLSYGNFGFGVRGLVNALDICDAVKGIDEVIA